MSGKIGSQFTNSGVIGSPVLGTPESGDLSDADLTFPTGHVIQQQQTVKQDTFAIANNTNQQVITGFHRSIVPIRASSKILLSFMFATSCAGDSTSRAYMERDIASGYSKRRVLNRTHGFPPMIPVCFVDY